MATTLNLGRAGKIKNWSEVGGAKGAITPYQREENSGSQQLMRDLVMKDVPFEKIKGEFARNPQLVGYLMSHVYSGEQFARWVSTDPESVGPRLDANA